MQTTLLQRVRGLPLGLLVVVALVLLGAVFPTDAVRDAVTFEPISEVTLHRPAAYVLLAPVSNVLDTITLLSLRQHVAFLLTIIVAYAVWWWFVGRTSLERVAPERRLLRETARIGVGLVLVVGLYSAATIMPRPMVSLEAGPNIIAIDFHAHTRFSHDGRPDWTPEDVRAWHRAAGFGAAYITDHRTFEGARDGWSNNPELAGENTVLLPAIEVVWRGEHVNVLDADRMYHGILTPDLRDIDEQALTLASAIPNAEPVLIETIPGDLSKMVAANGPRTAGARAIEIIDGSPKGLGQSRRERLRIIKYADSLNLAPVAGSDNHGWGRTASAWTLMFIPNWRAQSPEQLSSVISTTLRRGGSGSTKVAERYVANTDDALRLPFTVPLVTWGMMRTLTTDERVVWLVWTAILYMLWRVRRARRTAQAVAV
jgi:predicted metal-dependent phosphoesterase TrpH